MPRIAIIDRANMNAEQARVYDAAKAGSGIVGGPYYAYIRLPKLFEAAQTMRESLSGGPLSPREQQVINLTVARHWGARYPWFAQVRRSLAVGVPVTIHGMEVASGDLIHADRHGAVVVPADKIDAMKTALDGLMKQEARIITAARAPGATVETIKAAFRG